MMWQLSLQAQHLTSILLCSFWWVGADHGHNNKTILILWITLFTVCLLGCILDL
jgi:hypothetical protein